MSRHLRLVSLLATVALVAIVGTIAAAMTALVGADVPCGAGGATALAAGGPEPTRTALREIPPRWLAMFREAGSAIDISWPFLASIGDQECGFGTGDCYVVSPSGCAGPMEMAYVRGSACSPNPSVPTIWERFRTDGDGDGKARIFDDADSIFTAAKVLRSDGAPPVGGSFSAYHEAACNYYGACSDPSADYADEVMARAVSYGFGGPAEKKSPATGGSRSVAVGETTSPGGTTGGRRNKVGKRGAGEAPVAREPGGSRGGRGGAPAPSPGSVCGGGELILSTASANRIVAIAESQLGYQETGDNCQKYGPCESWCALFLYWVWERAGVPLEGGPPERAYSGSPYEWIGGGHGGRLLPPSATPAPGDAVMYGDGSNLPGEGMEHVGIVAKVFPDGEITTIAGNFDDEVALSGPFDPSQAVVSGGQPAPIYGYAEPPTVGGTGEAGSEGARGTGGIDKAKGSKRRSGR